MSRKTEKKDRHKPHRSVRIAEPLARLLEQLAREQVGGSTLTEQVRFALRFFLRIKGKIKPEQSDPDERLNPKKGK
jgi:hypothetical protein